MTEFNGYKALMGEAKIRLNGNESFNDIYKEYLSESLKNGLELNRYPEDESIELRKAYAKYVGVSEKNIIAGNGSDEMLQLIIGARIKKGKKFLTLCPDFSMYDFYVASYDGEIIKHDFYNDGEFDLEGFIEKGKSENVSLIMFSNPNNPTGGVLTEESIIKILEEFKDIDVVVDEAYVEFYGNSMIKYINKYKNLIVTRTLSKAWGLAAIRVGFLVANEEKIDELIKYKVPYNINSISQSIATLAINKPEIMEENLKIILAEREYLLKELMKIAKNNQGKIKFFDTKSNFIYAQSEVKSEIIKTLENFGIIIRNFNDDKFRLTVGSREDNNKIINIIQGVLRGDNFAGFSGEGSRL